MSGSRAAVVVAHNQPLEIQDVPIPKLEPTAMLARVEAATVCGTDVHRWHGPVAPPDRLPFIPGHETCGIIEEMNGERFDLLGQPLKVGDRVLWAYPSCGHCYWCTVAMQPSSCPGRMSWGHHPSDQYPYLLGGWSEYQYIPPAPAVIRVPEVVSSASAAAAACAYRTVMHGFDRLGPVRSHETFLIQGSGPLGIFAAAVARDHGAYQVLMIGAPEGRLKVAKEMGADHVLNIEEVKDSAERRQWVRDHTAGRGADVAIQVANSMAIPEGISMLRHGGRYVSIGGGGQASLPLNGLPSMITFTSIANAEPRHWLQAVEFLESRWSTLPFDHMISGSYSLDQVNEALQAMANFEVVKPVLYPHGPR